MEALENDELLGHLGSLAYILVGHGQDHCAVLAIEAGNKKL